MPVKVIVVLLALLGLGVWAWQRHGPALLREAGVGAPAAQPVKCLKGEQVLYTDGPCPPGSRRAVVDGGAVTVVPGQRPALPSLPAASMPSVRDVLAPPGGPDLREQRMEKTIGK